MRLSARVRLVLAATVAIALALSYAALRLARGAGVPEAGGWAIAAIVCVPVVLWSAHVIVARFEDLHALLGNALRAFRDGDYSLRLALRGDREVAELKRLYNELADALRADRSEIYNKEILLDTILQRTPIAVVLVNAADRVVFSNAAARELLAAGARLDGRLLGEILAATTPSLRGALAGEGDALFHANDEVFHVTRRIVRVHGKEHRLILLEHMTPELRRQEVAVWKKAIRMMNHEINNTVAPISSLFHSAKRAQELPEHRHRLAEIYELIEERLQFLREFLESYAEFARLPEPRKELTPWWDVLEAVQTLYPFRIEGDPHVEGLIDRAQMQQVLINLVKNAHESGSDPREIVVSVQRTSSDSVVRVLDRGRGMTEEVMRQAIVPFYTTKPGGSGLGLALSNEIIEAHGGRMRVAAREGGGTAVTCWLPTG